MKFLIAVFLTLFVSQAFSNDRESENMILKHLSESEKNELLLNYIDEDVKNQRREVVAKYIVDSSRSNELVELVDTGEVSPEFRLGPNTYILEYAILMNNVEVVVYLLNGYSYNQNQLQRAIEVSCDNGHLTLTKRLIEVGAKIKGEFGETGTHCLFAAISSLNTELVSMLIESGVEVEASGINGQSPEKYARALEKRVKNIVSLLDQW